MELEKNEKIKDVEGFEGLYAVTSFGRIWSHRRKQFVKTWPDAQGYLKVTFSVDNKQTSLKLHRLVGLAFVANPDSKPQINHKNGNKRDCRASNLEWVTARENMQHACDNGFNRNIKLSYSNKILACILYSVLKLKQNKIAAMLGVSPPAINYIIREYTPILAANHNL